MCSLCCKESTKKQQIKQISLYYLMTLWKIVIWISKLPNTWQFLETKWQKLIFLQKQPLAIFWKLMIIFGIFSKKCHVFGNFLTFTLQFSGGSDPQVWVYAGISDLGQNLFILAPNSLVSPFQYEWKKRIGLYEKDDQKEWKTETVQQLCCWGR